MSAYENFYPSADRSVQWFEDTYFGESVAPRCIVLHTTETSKWPSYGGGGSAPHFTGYPDLDNRRVVWRQHFSVSKPSRALENRAGGVETNRSGAVQVELIGSCAVGGPGVYWPTAPLWALRDVADLIRWCSRSWGIPLAAPDMWPSYPTSYGLTSARMTYSEWLSFTGICGHMHVPENVHGDPGNLDISRILALAMEGDKVSLSDEDVEKIVAGLLASKELREYIGKAVWQKGWNANGGTEDAAIRLYRASHPEYIIGEIVRRIKDVQP